MPMETALLRMLDVSKSFGATHALAGVSLEARGGEVLALIGENGAGKSTLMKILSGAVGPDRGQMELAGRRFAPRGPHAARVAGVAMIYQELNLAADLTVAENVMLGQEQHRCGLLRRAAQRDRVRRALELLGRADLPLDLPVRNLSMADQQMVEIARALALEAKVIVFDEPTSSLAQHDVENLFRVIEKLKRSGIAIIYISHFLEEIRRIADRYLVLRDGSLAGGGPLAGVGESEIVSLMVGRRVEELFPSVPHTPGEVVLSLEALAGRAAPQDVSFQLRRGEILGIAGLVGAGRTELLRCLLALDPVRAGTVRVLGTTPRATPRARIRAGLGLVSEDRKNEGLAQRESIADNITYSRLAPYSRLGWLNLRRRRAVVQDWMRRLNVKARSSEQHVEQLSGGNQQKVALARVLHQDADVLLLDEPTRGIDVGTKSEIYRLMAALAAEGKAIIFVSSYFTELLSVCDRVGVMARGRLREIRPAGQWTSDSLLSCALGVDTTTP
jgi:ribose transport system ATP-binding protein